MKKQDLAVIVVLFALMLAWPTVYRKLFPPAPQQVATSSAQQPVASEPMTTQTMDPEPVAAPSIEQAPEDDTAEEIASSVPEKILTLDNECLSIAVSSRGGGIVSAEMKQYRARLDPESEPLTFDFSKRPAMSHIGLPGFSASSDFDINVRSKSSIQLERTNSDGIHLVRTITLTQDYEIDVKDSFSHESDAAMVLPRHNLTVGPMKLDPNVSKASRQHNIGVDVLLLAAGEGVKNWASKLPGFFKAARKDLNLPRLPESVVVFTNTPAEWVAAKDKFFVQILEVDQESLGYEMRITRSLQAGEGSDPRVNPKNAEIASVSAALALQPATIEPGTTFSRHTKYYVGPKKLSILQKLGLHKDKIMDFGWWTPVCKILLRVLNAMYTVLPSYGYAIILLTILIRIIFWPLTHKSAESMKKMQALQPEMMELRKKYKNNPKTMQAETMALYKTHKVNPMSGCLPMLIQIPVFIALFVVLRSAIELRFAPFWWIKDLSEPEGLLAGVFPIPLNILPIIMAATMMWQQKLMPATDPNQQKIMTLFMPIMMLVMFYNMPSALVLYWSASQCIMIGQQIIQKKKAAGKTPEEAAKA